MNKQATALNPKYGKALGALGVALLRTGEEGESLFWLKEAWKVGRFNHQTMNLLNLYNDMAKKGFDMLSKLPIFIDDKPSITASQYQRRCKQLRLEHGVNLGVLDYLQRCNIEAKSGESREITVSRA